MAALADANWKTKYHVLLICVKSTSSYKSELSRGLRGTRDMHDHLFQGIFGDLTEGTTDISTIKGNFDKNVKIVLKNTSLSAVIIV